MRHYKLDVKTAEHEALMEPIKGLVAEYEEAKQMSAGNLEAVKEELKMKGGVKKEAEVESGSDDQQDD